MAKAVINFPVKTRDLTAEKVEAEKQGLPIVNGKQAIGMIKTVKPDRTGTIKYVLEDASEITTDLNDNVI